MGHQTDIYQKIIILMIRSKRHLFKVLEPFHMTPVQGTILMLFEPGQGRSMNSLSEIMGCDASNITGLVDRLESHGLIERTVDPQDRRVKLIKLSQKGLKCREQVLKGLSKAQAADLQRLTSEECETLCRLIDKLTADME